MHVLRIAVGKTIKGLRKQHGVSQEKLADAIDSHQVYISEIERGLKTPSLQILLEIAVFFGISLTELVSMIEKNIYIYTLNQLRKKKKRIGKNCYTISKKKSQSGSTGGSATTCTFSPDTGCTNEMLRECRLMPPSGLERGKPYFKSPLI